MINLEAPIIPWIGMGGIKLYSHISELKALLQNEKVECFLYDKFLVRYEIKGKIYLFINLINGKLFKITTLEEYKGLLFDEIYVGQKTEDMLSVETSFEYDDFEEVYVSPKGVFVETDSETETVQWISVFIKELETDDFEDGNW
ncbi:hypothetical protein C8E03_1267 [Lachnotalea glycerini]|uniref:Uncharacterized protein n=1 Tax=Lachnotalea glycerini TaxID=1763509 RepID=A0A255II73_9FIRM|nr:hypothetical protein [Lachnotalea glycerini]PXV84584.1 hypothetical protein C8E03_1267 [Lachnotalea glycerini]RDY27356.1 hypothetical protein CG710_020785 [Lachnotalea glycerini]